MSAVLKRVCLTVSASLPLLALAACASGGDLPAPADLVVTNSRIYTVNAARSWAEALAVRDGRLVVVGLKADVEPLIGPATRVVDLESRLMLPGFHDSHVHPVTSGLEALRCDLNDLPTADAVLARVSACAVDRPERPWLLGGGFSLPVFPGGNPSKALLDAIESQRPVYLTSADGHSAWVNSKALAVAGISRDTPDPPRGRIERDPATGEPSGALREEAMALVARHVPAPTAADYTDGLTHALGRLAAAGVVSLQEASATEEILQAYLTADRDDRLTARVRAAIQVDPGRDVEQIAGLEAWRERYRGRRLQAASAKFFVDGVIEARTGALLEPYVGGPDAGTPNFDQARLDRLVAGLDARGFQIHLHAIGDRAIRMGLDALERARAANGPRDARPHLAHIQLFDPADIPRFARLGAIANFQPLWAYADSYIVDLTEPVLGPVRSRWLYPIRSLMDSGAVVAAGSDWSVSSPDPLRAMEVAVTRQEPGAPQGPGWLPAQRVDLPRIIAAYTMGGAYVNFEERESGSLEAGKLADFVVLDRDIFEVPANEIHTARVLWTVVEGREVYRADDWPVKVSGGS